MFPLKTSSISLSAKVCTASYPLGVKYDTADNFGKNTLGRALYKTNKGKHSTVNKNEDNSIYRCFLQTHKKENSACTEKSLVFIKKQRLILECFMPCVQANICAHRDGVENLGRARCVSYNSLNLEYENMDILSSHSKRHRESSK